MSYNSQQFSVMERVLYNLHHQVCSYALRKTSSQGRNLAEKLVLILAVCGFGALLLAHLSFVYRGNSNTSTSTTSRVHQVLLPDGMVKPLVRNIPLTCLSNIPGFTNDFDVMHLRLLLDNDDNNKNNNNNGAAAVVKESFAFVQQSSSDDNNNVTTAQQEGNNDNNYCIDDESSETVGCCSASANSISATSATAYSYSQVMGYLLLPPEIAHQRQLKIQHVMVSKTDVRCFGEPFLQKLVFGVTGPDTVMINWLLALHDGKSGFVYNPRTDTMIDLKQHYNNNNNNAVAAAAIAKTGEMSLFNKNNNRRSRTTTTTTGKGGGSDEQQRKEKESSSSSSQSSESSSSIRGWYYRLQIISKLALVLKTSFLFFITTTLVSFTLRETQGRMLDFTHQLQAHVRSHRPVAQLVTTHLVENLVFVPIVRFHFVSCWLIIFLSLIPSFIFDVLATNHLIPFPLFCQLLDGTKLFFR